MCNPGYAYELAGLNFYCLPTPKSTTFAWADWPVYYCEILVFVFLRYGGQTGIFVFICLQQSAYLVWFRTEVGAGFIYIYIYIYILNSGRNANFQKLIFLKPKKFYHYNMLNSVTSDTSPLKKEGVINQPWRLVMTMSTPCTTCAPVRIKTTCKVPRFWCVI